MTSNDNHIPDPIARLRATTGDDASIAQDGSCVAELLHRVEPAELIEFVQCLADRLFGRIKE